MAVRGDDLHPRWWYSAGFLLTLLVILVTSKPAFDRPQAEADGYRYLAKAQALESGTADGWQTACVVENRWDHLWWVKPRAALRFFRPVVVLSFWLDAGGDFARMLWTNVALHVACSWLVLLLVFGLVGPGLPGLLAALLFAGMACHGEALWYLTGRNATLAAVGFLGALLCHVHGARFLGMLPLAFALCAKESTAVLPLVCLCFDMWGDDERRSFRVALTRRRWTYVGYALIIAMWLIVRRATLGPADAGEVFPYLVSPFDSRFPMHVVTQLLSYAQNLAGAVSSDPFLTWSKLVIETHAAVELVLIVGLSIVLLWRDRRCGFLLAFGVICWLPASVVYVSERYIYLTSVAFVAVVGMVLARVALRPRGPQFALVIGLSLIAHQTYRLHQKLTNLNRLRPTNAVALEVLDALPNPPAGKTLYFLQFPGDWVNVQLLEAQLRVIYQRPDLRAAVLSPRGNVQSRIRVEDEHTLSVTGGHALLDRGRAFFPWVDLSKGRTYTAPGFGVEIVDGEAERCTALRYRFDAPLRDAVVLEFEAPTQAAEVAQWIRAGRFVVR